MLSYEIETHLNSCPLCSRKFKSEKMIESAIREKMPRDRAPLIFRQRLIRDIDRRETRSYWWVVLSSLFQSRPRRVLSSAAVIAIIVGSFYPYRAVRTLYFPIFQEALNNHTNFLEGRFSLEIASSDTKEISSWLQQQVDFPVPEFTGERIELLGGKLIQIKDQDAAYFFYRGQEHDISFLMHDCTGLRLPRVRSVKMDGQKFDIYTSQGYNVIHLEDHHERACTIVSDMDLQLLLEFLSRTRPSLT